MKTKIDYSYVGRPQPINRSGRSKEEIVAAWEKAHSHIFLPMGCASDCRCFDCQRAFLEAMNEAA